MPCLEDILCYRKTFEEHLHNLRTVFCRLRQFGVKLKDEKCILFEPEVKYLGKVISKKRCKDDPVNTEAIEKLCEPPKTVRTLLKPLVYLGYYWQPVKHFSQKAKPIYQILSLPSKMFPKKNHKSIAKT